MASSVRRRGVRPGLWLSVLGGLLLAAFGAGCEATIPENQLECQGRGQCPGGWFCIAERCVSEPPGWVPTYVATGGAHSCASFFDGSLYCWGNNESGQLGLSSTSSAELTPVRLAGSYAELRDLEAGDGHTCAAVGEELLCWGQNAQGQLGVSGSPAQITVPTPVVGLPGTIRGIAAGAAHTCAIHDGGLWCWGDNSRGQVGINSMTTPVREPAMVFPAGSGIRSVAAGTAHTCVLNNGGEIFCWGDNAFAQLNQPAGAPAQRLSPASVPDLEDVTALASGYRHNCAVRFGNQVWCWGHDQFAELGRGTRGDPTVAIRVTTLPEVEVGLVAVGGFGNPVLGAGLSFAGGGGLSLHYWGAFSILPASAPVPFAFPSDGRTTAVSAGGAHACVIRSEQVWCGGDNSSGQLGTGNTDASGEPLLVVGLPDQN